jgi:hypothetical protein
MKKRRFTKRQAAKAKGYRSGLEVGLAEALTHVGINGEYEQHKIKYVKPATNHTYTPDFRLPNGIFIETKGRFVAEDRKKHILIKDQHPELDIRFVFQNSKNKIRKGSNTTYADWCEKHGFQYADKTIPETWLNSQ